jgi:hypothetical protein
MPKHWKMQALIRDKTNGRVLGHQRPRTFPPDIGARMLRESPNDWEVLDDDLEVGGDPRGSSVPKSSMKAVDDKAPPKAFGK